ncbi:hypothetical protein LOTGIDRAFT_236383 [Lottia gigantea]|uniref:Uncharacterized protein n=1 Tax=Lottia gigantea TaxID=225164 RepID=V3ZSL5_LOTGI|nr:hypothetical protein LOTGIDRAFT_236383 [Lottia gigantea]ESO83871.1 hypothetical protein LOTGIDRAFT_236383 [Lottia gigantea]
MKNMDEKDIILKRLHDFGESVIGRKTKKKKVENIQTLPLDEKSLLQREKNRKRKNRRKRRNEMKSETEESKPKKLSDIEKIVEMFDISDQLVSVKTNNVENSECEVKTVQYTDFVDKDISLQHQTTSKKPKNKNYLEEKEVFIFKDPQKIARKKAKTKPKESEKQDEKPEQDEHPIFDMDEAKFEVRKLGITGFEENKQEDSIVDLLVSLGAKPPKKKYVNYKEFQKQRKEEIIKDKEKKEMDRKLGLRVKKGGFVKKSKKDINDISIRDGQIGRYEHGTQYIKKRDIRRK